MLQRVPQLHSSGCFIACVAMLLEISYQEAFSRLFPNTPMPCPEQNSWASVGRLIDESLELLPRVGLEPQPAKIRSVKSLRKRTSLIILRWKNEPTLSHGIVFDGETGTFLDPCYQQPLSHRVYNRNLENIYYIKRTSHGVSIRDTDNGRNQSTGGLSDGGSLPSSETLTGDALFV
jgi:hypothetical protein